MNPERLSVGIVLAALAAAAHSATADTWKHYTREDTPGLPGNEVQFLAPAREGGVWIGTLTGAAWVRDGEFKPLLDAKGAPLGRSVWWVHEAADRTWIGHSEGVAESRGGKLREALAGRTVAPIVELKPGVLWALGKDPRENVTLYEWRGEEWKPVEAVGKRRITNLYKTKNGKAWLTLDGNGVLEVDPEVGLEKAAHHLEALNVTTVFQASNGVMWFGLWANGVASWDGTAWKRELPKARESAILAMAEDTQANLWVATSANGLWKRPLHREEWTSFLAEEGAINLLAVTKDGRVWVSSQAAGGLRFRKGDEWIVSLDSPLPIRALVEAADGALWAGGVLDGVYRLGK
jgi:ligand-binding sensor domain-containing protein